MKRALFYIKVLIISFILMGCQDSGQKPSVKKAGSQERIKRTSNDSFFIPPAKKVLLPPYPWEDGLLADIPKITKEFFRCKGSSLNPELAFERRGKIQKVKDCQGSEKHSLSIINGKEEVYPILIDLLNYIQAKMEKKVVITSGHRCPDHNTYVDPSIQNISSKHMIGAEVSFYVQGMEYQPEDVIALIFDYYKNKTIYENDKEFIEFKRYESSNTNVSTKPWYNKEIFIKLFKRDEGRNFDNRTPYPYIGIQVRFDKNLNERVIYSWEKAKNILRE